MPIPFCTGNNEEHCCYVDGQVCEHLVENDPRAPGRRWACGLFLTLTDQFSNKPPEWIWAKVYAHPLYDRMRQFWLARGIDDCGSFRGYRRADGGCDGQCCYKGWKWDADGNVEEQP